MRDRCVDIRSGQYQQCCDCVIRTGFSLPDRYHDLMCQKRTNAFGVDACDETSRTKIRQTFAAALPYNSEDSVLHYSGCCLPIPRSGSIIRGATSGLVTLSDLGRSSYADAVDGVSK